MPDNAQNELPLPADTGQGLGGRSVQETGNVSPPFIPAVLDDYGLTAPEFRVLCRICRRGICSESVANIAAGCRLHPDTAQDVLNRLVALRMVSKEKRPGASSIYCATAPGEWVKPTRNGYLPETEGHPSNSPNPYPSDSGNTTPKRRGTKGILLRVSHKEGSTEALRRSSKAFQAPTLEEVKLHAGKIGLSDHEAEKFFSHYASNGWRVGKNPMRSWQQALVGWKLRTQDYHHANNPRKTSAQNHRNAGVSANPTTIGAQTAAIVARRSGTPMPNPVATQVAAPGRDRAGDSNNG